MMIVLYIVLGFIANFLLGMFLLSLVQAIFKDKVDLEDEDASAICFCILWPICVPFIACVLVSDRGQFSIGKIIDKMKLAMIKLFYGDKV